MSKPTYTRLVTDTMRAWLSQPEHQITTPATPPPPSFVQAYIEAERTHVTQAMLTVMGHRKEAGPLVLKVALDRTLEGLQARQNALRRCLHDVQDQVAALYQL